MESRRSRRSLRLNIDAVIERAEELAALVARELPTHGGIIRAARGVADAAREAKRVACALRRPWSPHRIPAVFLALALAAFAVWLYWNFLYVPTLTIALPKEDAMGLRQRLSGSEPLRFAVTVTEGSRESMGLMAEGKIDLAFVQGGVPIPDDLPRLQNPGGEVILYLVHRRVRHANQVRKIMTSAAGQGSHSVGQVFLDLWGWTERVEFVHDWRRFNVDKSLPIPPDIDAVFVIKDLAEQKTLDAIERLAAAGFRLTSPDLGAHALALRYLEPTELPRGYLGRDPPIPEQAVTTYKVATYLVARRDLTPRLLAVAARLLDNERNTLLERSFEPSLDQAGEVLQGLEAFLGILLSLGLAFLTLLGLETASYQRRFHELNTLSCLVSIPQSNKDVLGLSDEIRRTENLLYLSTCSDLLGLIGVIGGYYAQERGSLLYSNLLGTVHERSAGLKLNIQIKILHAAVPWTPFVQSITRGPGQ